MAQNSNYIHDRPAQVDSLGRTHFAEALSTALLLPRDSPGLVVGVEGSWGSGKSTLIGFITKILSKKTSEKPPIVVEFNPWMISNTGALVEALITQIATSIGKDFEYSEKGIKAGQKLLNYVGLLKYFKYLKYAPGLSWAGNFAEDISEITGQIAAVATDGVESGQKTLDDIKKFLPSIDLTKKKHEVMKALAELDRPIVVIIDDLDRLPSEEIRSMIQAIKAVADFPRITYLLAYDRSIVARALGDDEASGLLYLEKIVQVAYPIPPLFQRQLKKFTEEKIHLLLDQLKISLRDYEKEIYDKAIDLVAQLSRHPRDIIRIINRLILSLPATVGEVNSVDVIVFEALSQRFPIIRESVHKHPAAFTGHRFRGDLIDEDEAFNWGYFLNETKKDNEPLWTKFLPINESERDVAQKACHFLFALAKDDSSYSNHEDHLRIADPDRLARLFRMASIEDVPEAKDIHKLLRDQTKLKEALATVSDNELLFLLEWIYNYIPSCINPDVKNSIEQLIDLINEKANKHELHHHLAISVEKVMKQLLRIKSSDRNEAFILIIEKISSLTISEKIVLLAVAEQGKWIVRPGDKKNSDQQLIEDTSLVDKAVQIWSAKVRVSITDGQIHNEINFHSVLYRLAQFNGSYTEVYAAVSKICESNEGLIKFLSAFDPFKQNPDHFHLERVSLIEDANQMI